MISKTDYLKLLYSEAAECLIELGFIKRKQGIYTLKLNDNKLGWLGLNLEMNTWPDAIGVNPVVGIRDNDIHDFIAKINQTKPHKYLPPTISKNIGYLMPKNTFHQIVFKLDENPQDNIKELVTLLRQYAMPYIESLMDMSNRIQELNSNCPLAYKGERIISSLFLANRANEINEFVTNILNENMSNKCFDKDEVQSFAYKVIKMD